MKRLVVLSNKVLFTVSIRAVGDSTIDDLERLSDFLWNGHHCFRLKHRFDDLTGDDGRVAAFFCHAKFSLQMNPR